METFFSTYSSDTMAVFCLKIEMSLFLNVIVYNQSTILLQILAFRSVNWPQTRTVARANTTLCTSNS